VCQHLSVARVAEALAVSWKTANNAVPEEGRRVLITDPGRFDGVRVLGVDEHVWRHTRRGDKFVTVIIDLTGVREGTGPARLLDMVEGRSKQAFIAWLAAQSSEFRARIEVVAMDGFTGFKTAATDQLPDATAVMDPFHVVALAGDALDRCRQRVQQSIHGHRGRTGADHGDVPDLRMADRDRPPGRCTAAAGSATGMLEVACAQPACD
jgi:transposase